MSLTLNRLFKDGPLEIDPTKKMTVSFIPSGLVPSQKLRHPKIRVTPDKPFSSLIQHVRTSLNLKPDEAIFLYAQQAYMPDEDLLCHDLNLLCGIDNVITIHYSLEPVWG